MKVLAEGLRFPEGPVALPDGTLLVVEIASGCLSRILPDGRVEVVARPGGGPNGAAIGPGGYCYVCNNGGMRWVEDAHGLRPAGQPQDYSGGRIERVDLTTGAVQVVLEEVEGRPLKGPNDLVFDAHGGFWFTDLGKARDREMDRGSVHYCPGDGTPAREIIFPLITPNGIALSPDGRCLYVAETVSARIWRFDLDGPGVVRHAGWPSVHGGVPIATLTGYARPDSMAVEASGNLCVATLGTGGITVLDPQGDLVEFVPLPDSHVTNICFGGSDMCSAFVTLSGSGRLACLPWPRPGLALAWQQACL